MTEDDRTSSPEGGAGGVRPYAAHDADACCAVILACMPQVDGLNDAARCSLEAKLVPERVHAELGSMRAFVYELDGRVVGVGALDGNEAKRLYVHPSTQGRGIARRLFERVEGLAREQGLSVLVGDASPAAAPFYERLGFVAEGRSETLRGDARFTTIRVYKRLRS